MLVKEDQGLSITGATAFCATQKQLQKLKIPGPFKETTDTGEGKIGEAIIAAALNNKKTGLGATGLREAGTRELESLRSATDEETMTLLYGMFEETFQGAINYLAVVDYDPLETGLWFKMQLDGMTRPTRGQLDILARRDDKPLIIDLKRKKKKLTDYQISMQHEWRWQLASYAFWLMVDRNLDEIPACEIHVWIPGGQPQIIKFDITGEDIYESVAKLQQYNFMLDNGWFPLARGHFLCKPKWCQAYQYCHETFFVPTDDLIKRARSI